MIMSGQFESEPSQKQQSDDWQKPPSPVPQGGQPGPGLHSLGLHLLKLLPHKWQSEVTIG